MSGSPEYIQNISCDQGIAFDFGEDENDQDWLLTFSLYAGESWYCECSGDDCSDDGLLWQPDDMGSPYVCTNHFFPLENLGCELVAYEVSV